MKVAALQAWFGQDKEFAATRQRVLAFAKGTNDAAVARRAVLCSVLLPTIENAELDVVRALALRAAKLDKVGMDTPMAFGMAEYRSANYAAAQKALLAAEETGKQEPYVMGTSAFFRAMSLFRQGKKDEARKLAIAAAAKMNPLPKDEQNPLQKRLAGPDSQNDLIVWLAYKEAKAMIQFDAPPDAATPPDAK